MKNALPPRHSRASHHVVLPQSDFLSKLNKVIQLTGRSDPIYSEATVTVHQYDILLDILVVNQSDSTMQNLTVELATMGDLKLCERPQSYTLASHESIGIKANIKVSSTETGLDVGKGVQGGFDAVHRRVWEQLPGHATRSSSLHIVVLPRLSPWRAPSCANGGQWIIDGGWLAAS